MKSSNPWALLCDCLLRRVSLSTFDNWLLEQHIPWEPKRVLLGLKENNFWPISCPSWLCSKLIPSTYYIILYLQNKLKPITFQNGNITQQTTNMFPNTLFFFLLGFASSPAISSSLLPSCQWHPQLHLSQPVFHRHSGSSPRVGEQHSTAQHEAVASLESCHLQEWYFTFKHFIKKAIENELNNLQFCQRRSWRPAPGDKWL